KPDCEYGAALLAEAIAFRTGVSNAACATSFGNAASGNTFFGNAVFGNATVAEACATKSMSPKTGYSDCRPAVTVSFTQFQYPDDAHPWSTRSACVYY